MTQVEFHTGVAEPTHFACRLLRKAYRQGARVAVMAPAATLRALDRELWTFEERDFVPHVLVSHVFVSQARGGHSGVAPALLARTPLWLLDDAMLGPGSPEGLPAGTPAVWVNVGSDAPVPTAIATRLIEIVARDADHADRARLRWRHYRDLGWNVVHHNAALSA